MPVIPPLDRDLAELVRALDLGRTGLLDFLGRTRRLHLPLPPDPGAFLRAHGWKRRRGLKAPWWRSPHSGNCDLEHLAIAAERMRFILAWLQGHRWRVVASEPTSTGELHVTALADPRGGYLVAGQRPVMRALRRQVFRRPEAGP